MLREFIRKLLGSDLNKSVITFESSMTQGTEGSTKLKKVSVSTEDIIAIGAVLVALLIVAGMMSGTLPINEYTYGLAGLSAVAGALAKYAGHNNAKPN